LGRLSKKKENEHLLQAAWTPAPPDLKTGTISTYNDIGRGESLEKASSKLRLTGVGARAAFDEDG